MNRLVIALVVSAGLVASSLLGIFATGGPEISGINALSVMGFLVSGILGFLLLWGVLPLRAPLGRRHPVITP